MCEQADHQIDRFWRPIGFGVDGLDNTLAMVGKRGDLTPEQYEILFGALPPNGVLSASDSKTQHSPESATPFIVSEGTAPDVRRWWRQRRIVAPVVTAILGLCALVVIGVSFRVSDGSVDTPDDEMPEASAFVDEVGSEDQTTTVVAEETSTSATATPTTSSIAESIASPTTAAATEITAAPPEPSGPAQLEITRCDARREVVTIMNTGGEAITLNGWVLHNDGRTHEADLSALSLDPGARVVMLSGERAEDPVDAVRWTDADVWNNDGDVATLLRVDEVVSTLGC